MIMLYHSENKKIHQHNVKFKDKLLPGLASKGLAFHHGKFDMKYTLLHHYVCMNRGLINVA